MTRLSVATVCAAALAFGAASALAQSAASAPKKATPRQQLKSQAKGLALATETVETITANQLEIAHRVLTGTAQCEFNQHVDVDAVDGHPGHFRVGYKNMHYMMVPQETTTGAVRLEDKKAGIVWLQIPAKSMMMNSKLGQRMVDGCMHAEQRAATDAAAKAASAP
ncbi:MAG TPA: hypothetical protein VJ608_09500 [Albitalea sp.]|nr:hypothetical protein [Albitalea sp.]